MKIIICCIIIILLLYFSLQFKETYSNDVSVNNIDTGIIINIDKDDISNDFNKNYDTITKYNKDFKSNFKSEILFYKFMEDSLFKIKPEDSNDITIGFYLLYPRDYGATAGQATSSATTGQATSSATTGQATSSATGTTIAGQAIISANTGQAISSANTDKAIISANTGQAIISANTDKAIISANTGQAISSANIGQVEQSVQVDKFANNNEITDNVLTINNILNTTNIFNFKTLKKDNGFYRVTMNYDDNTILTLDDLELDNIENLGWFLITLNKDEIKLSFQNNPYQTKILKNHNIPIKIEEIIFNQNLYNTNRYVGRIIVWDKNELDTNDICSTYYCGKHKCSFDLSNLKSEYDKCRDTEECDEDLTRWSSMGNTTADICIKECNKPYYRCNKKECQEMCINCKNNEEEEWTPIMKKSICPWYTSIKKEIKVPESPIIRGFPGVSNDTESNNDSTIVIEWKKPFNNMAKITKYLLEVREELSKRPSRKVIILKHDNCDICEYVITNLKNQTTYSIELSAYNRKGLSNKSNKLIITTNGSNNEFLSNINNDISGENQKYNEYKCVREFDNSDHMLDRVMDEDINVYNYVKSRQL
jgi:hypothetical protein